MQTATHARTPSPPQAAHRPDGAQQIPPERLCLLVVTALSHGSRYACARAGGADCFSASATVGCSLSVAVGCAPTCVGQLGLRLQIPKYDVLPAIPPHTSAHDDQSMSWSGLLRFLLVLLGKGLTENSRARWPWLSPLLKRQGARFAGREEGALEREPGRRRAGMQAGPSACVRGSRSESNS